MCVYHIPGLPRRDYITLLHIAEALPIPALRALRADRFYKKTVVLDSNTNPDVPHGTDVLPCGPWHRIGVLRGVNLTPIPRHFLSLEARPSSRARAFPRLSERWFGNRLYTMQGLDFTSPLPGVQGRDNSLAELDALDVDNLLSMSRAGFPLGYTLQRPGMYL